MSLCLAGLAAIGGTGFLGRHIVVAVAAHDPQAELRLLVRRRSAQRPPPPIHCVQGDLVSPATYAEALRGVHTVIHSAAQVSFGRGQRDLLYKTNVTGTRALVEAAVANGCSNFIHISSISAIGRGAGELMDESLQPEAEALALDPYGHSKVMAEREVLRCAGSMRVTLLNPSLIIGPGSRLWGRALHWLRLAPVLPMLTTLNSFVDVRDVAQAVVLALDNPHNGERYIVTAENIDMLRFSRCLLRVLGSRARVVPVVPGLLRAGDAVVAALEALHLNPGLRRPSALNVDKAYSGQKIRRELGGAPVYSLEQSLRDSLPAHAAAAGGRGRMLKLAGRAAVITGAASGLGRELALALAARGCCLYLVDRDLVGLQDLQRQRPAGLVEVFVCDLADPLQRTQLIAAITAEVAQLSLLINCAGIGSHSSLGQLSPGEVSQVLQVNTVAPLELTAALYPLLTRSPGACLVNIGSTAGEAAVPSMGLYCASKAGVHAFSRAIAMEVWGTAVRCLLVVLGSLRDTRFARSIRHPVGGQPGWYRRLDARPPDVARAIVAAIERGHTQLIYPGWYGPVLGLVRLFQPLATRPGSVGS